MAKERAKTNLYQPKLDFSRTSSHIKKSDQPGPPTYKAAKSKDSQSLKRSIEFTVPKAKNINFIGKSLNLLNLLLFFISGATLNSKKKIPGVGHYKMEEQYKRLASPATSLKIRRHWYL